LTFVDVDFTKKKLNKPSARKSFHRSLCLLARAVLLTRKEKKENEALRLPGPD
jgi:hypothetical protein